VEPALVAALRDIRHAPSVKGGHVFSFDSSTMIRAMNQSTIHSKTRIYVSFSPIDWNQNK
jgi:hypothetical protein